MVSDDLYERCLPLLDDKELEEEDKVEKVEELLRKEGSLSGAALENGVLDTLWRHRNASQPDSSQTPLRHAVVRAPRPAPRVPTPLGSPLAGASPTPVAASLVSSRPSFSRQKSTAPSPFASPRPSPRLAFAAPIPHSPSLNAYEFSRDSSPAPDIYGDMGSDNVDWLVADDAVSVASSTGTGQLSAAAPEWVPQPDMEPYEILKSVLGGRKTEEAIKEALEHNSYDFEAAIAALTAGEKATSPLTDPSSSEDPGSILIGRSMNVEAGRPVTPSNNQSSIVCRYWLKTGSCYRSDCRYAHDLGNHLCKYEDSPLPFALAKIRLDIGWPVHV